jgi:hypothetical protein
MSRQSIQKEADRLIADLQRGTTEKEHSRRASWPAYVNFTTGREFPRRYSVPSGSMKIAQAWAEEYKTFGDRRRVGITVRRPSGTILLSPNEEMP